MPSPLTQNQTPALTPLHYEQDGAYFNFRDRPFYEISFEAETEDGMSLGCCPSFNATAPFHVGDFDMPGAILAREWFVAECARHGFEAIPAADYDARPVFDMHPAYEAADMLLYRADQGPVSVVEFVDLRSSASDIGFAGHVVVSAMVPQPFQQQQASAAPLTLPAGYSIEERRDGYALHSDHFGEIGEGDYGCWASACDAAHVHADEVADPADAEAVERAYNAILDGFHALASHHLAQPVEDAETRGQHRAARALIAAIDGISAPASQKEAA